MTGLVFVVTVVLPRRLGLLVLWPDKMQPSLQHRRPLVWSFLVALIELANGFLIPRQEAASQASSSLVVDLGYATYEGYIDSAFGVNVWKGYARPSNRFSSIRSYLTCALEQHSLRRGAGRSAALASAA